MRQIFKWPSVLISALRWRPGDQQGLRAPSFLQPSLHCRQRHCRRGVLLLVVLSLLVLFALIGVTFVLVTSQNRRIARADNRSQQSLATDPQSDLDNIFFQLVADTTNGASSLRTQSLLNDIYGTDGALGSYVNTNVNYVPSTSLAQTQFLDIQIPAITNVAGSPIPTSTQIQTAGYFNGCVLTMVTGPAANLSTRIVGWGYTSPPGQYTMRILAFDGFDNSTLQSTTGTFKFLINGHPFNGTGGGFNVATGKTDSTQSFSPSLGAPVQIPYAFLPNPRFFQPTGLYSIFGGFGGADEDYDAADPQNMFLAYMSTTPTASSEILPSFHRPDLYQFMSNNATYASVWNDSNAGPALRRQLLVRPVGKTVGVSNPDHQNFTGSNSNVNGFDPINGPWDLDNDRDGIPDSIWIDAGLPVQTTSDGRRFKPLAAILCIDLDGRLNVNAHGSLAHVDAAFATPNNFGAMTPANRFLGGPTSTTGPNFATDITTNQVFAGMGFGPADVSLAPLFLQAPSYAPNASALTYYRNLLTGDSSGNQGRYGKPDTGGIFTDYPYTYLQESPLGLLKFFEYPVPNYPTTPSGYPYILNAFKSPPDLWGRAVVGLDVRGTPLMAGVGVTLDASNSPQNDTLNNPYELNLSRKAARATPTAPDNAFTTSELERILRFYDIDAISLPDRLRALLDPTSSQFAVLRHTVTTDGFDLPSPSVLAPSDLRVSYPATSASQTLVDLVTARMAAANGWTVTALTPAQQSTVNGALTTLLPKDMMAGLRMDINRPFGNGRDDNTNGVVDEPSEATSDLVWFPATGPSLPPSPASLSKFSGIPFDADNDGNPNNPADTLSRQDYAKELYVLMLLLIDPSVLANQIDFDNNGVIEPNETQRGIAQWAINVADFKDSDSIMTPFQYTINPFLVGWTAGAQNLNSPPAGTDLVWGCERPELLITETLAVHDRRTEDLPNDDNSGPNTGAGDMMAGRTTDSSPSKDSDFDQRLLPMGACFIELYNPWTTSTWSLKPDGTTVDATGNSARRLESPGEFYDVTTNTPTGVQLDHRANGVANGSPVWRLLVVKGTQPAPPALGLPYGERKDPEDPNANGVNNRPIASNPPVLTDDVERSVYFVDPTASAAPITDHGQPYWTNLPIAPLYPSYYAVVGSAGFADPAHTTPQRYVTPIGRPLIFPAPEGTDYSTTRQIALTPAAAGSPPQRLLILNNGANTEPSPLAGQSTTADVQPAVVAAINQTYDSASSTTVSRSFSISEPTGLANDPYYTTYRPVQTLAGSSEQYFSTIIDEPLDKKRLRTLPRASTDFAALATNGTTLNFRTIHLQRLANPLQNWDPITNPYRTVDTMTVDLTVFNGAWDPSKPLGVNDPPLVPAATGGLASLQRGDPNALKQNITANNLWQHQPPNQGVITSNADQTSQNFKYFMLHTLGYLNRFAVPGAAGSSNAPINAYTSATAPAVSTTTEYVNAPNGNLPFDWLTWNNRPFANAMELMLVPKSRSSKLLYDFVNYPPTAPTNSFYTSPMSLAAPTTTIAVLGHLLPFFQTASAVGPPIQGPNFHRILDFVQTPSRFVGNEVELNPTNFVAPLPNEAGLLSFYHSPFNVVSNYREPGKININTIPIDSNTNASANAMTSRVWIGLMNVAPNGIGTQFGQIVGSRRGYDTPGLFTELSNDATNTWPSYFSNPFRSASGAALTLSNLVGKPPRTDADVTLRRRADAATLTDIPLFSYQSTNAIDNSSRNPYFRNQIYQRLANSITTRSNVYAIWITVGYFEVSANPGGVDLGHPDGYQLGQELGSDTSSTVRHRGFYIFDRSIPVGFEPGHNHNVNNGVLLRQFVE